MQVFKFYDNSGSKVISPNINPYHARCYILHSSLILSNSSPILSNSSPILSYSASILSNSSPILSNSSPILSNSLVGLHLYACTCRGQKFHLSARYYKSNLERMSNSSQSTRPTGRVLWEELLEEVILHITPLCCLLHTLLKYKCMCLEDQ